MGLETVADALYSAVMGTAIHRATHSTTIQDDVGTYGMKRSDGVWTPLFPCRKDATCRDIFRILGNVLSHPSLEPALCTGIHVEPWSTSSIEDSLASLDTKRSAPDRVEDAARGHSEREEISSCRAWRAFIPRRTIGAAMLRDVPPRVFLLAPNVGSQIVTEGIFCGEASFE